MRMFAEPDTLFFSDSKLIFALEDKKSNLASFTTNLVLFRSKMPENFLLQPVSRMSAINNTPNQLFV